MDGAADNGARQEGAGRPVLVGMKLHPPPVREETIPRERLLERLRSGSDRRLTLVACPAGFGKTTLLAAWREAEAARKPAAWLTLDEGDNDPMVLWSYAIEALRRASPAIASAVSARTGVAPVVDVVLPRLVNELDGQGEVTLILDDFHRLSSSSTSSAPSGACRREGPWPR
jgi:LuxR family maltose regulon positive regulatory protein